MDPYIGKLLDNRYEILEVVGTGGMATKLTAAKRAMAHGIDMVIANSDKLDTLYDIVEGKDVGTRFVAGK